MFTSDDKYKILRHFWDYGIDSTIDAFEISRATLFRWQKKYVEGHYSKDNLKDKSRKPRNYKRSTVDTRIIQFIQKERLLHLGFGQRKLKPLIDQYIRDNPDLHISTISTDTIARIIKKLKTILKIYLI